MGGQTFLSVLRMTIGNRRRLSRMCLAFVATLLFPAVGLPGVGPEQAKPASAPAMGQLKIEGDAIERLTLSKRIGNTNTFDAAKPLIFERPGASVSMPTGQYLPQIELRGGYTAHFYIQSNDGRTGTVLPNAEWLTISLDKSCTLKAGAPLKLVPRVYRLGRTIRLSYELLDAQGRRYYGSKSPRPIAQFAIYQADREIVSSESLSLEYG
jgi:hypothetical protein